MITKDLPVKKPRKAAQPRTLPKVVPWALLGLAVVVLVLLASVGPDRLLALATRGLPFQGEGPLSLTVLHTNDTWGFVLPCGWRDPIGGVARRATKVKETRAGTQNVLLVDAGNSLTTSPEDAGSQEPSPRDQGRTGIEVLNRLGYDAVAIGEKDLLLGAQDLKQRISEAKNVVFVSANLVDKATGKLLVKPYVIKPVGGHRVALIGITGGLGKAQDFTLVPPLDAAREYVQEVQSQADIVILLSNAGLAANKAIATSVPGIDLIVNGGDLDPLPKPLRPENGALIVQADASMPGHAGRYLGRLKAEFDRSGALTGHTWETIELGSAVADDPESAAWVATVTRK